MPSIGGELGHDGRTVTVADGTTTKTINITTAFNGGAWMHFPITVPSGGLGHHHDRSPGRRQRRPRGASSWAAPGARRRHQDRPRRRARAPARHRLHREPVAEPVPQPESSPSPSPSPSRRRVPARARARRRARSSPSPSPQPESQPITRVPAPVHRQPSDSAISVRPAGRLGRHLRPRRLRSRRLDRHHEPTTRWACRAERRITW